MSSPASAVHVDLAFLRSLAEDGAPALRTAGAVIALAGIVFGLNALRFWAIDMGFIAWPEALTPFLAWDALLAQLALSPVVVWLTSRGRALKRGGSAGGRAVSAALSAVGGALTAAMLALAAAAIRLQDPTLALSVFPIVLFALNGAAWWVAFAVYRRTWTLAVALGSFLTTLGLGWFAETPTQWLILGLGLFAWLAVPGIALTRQAGGSLVRGDGHRPPHESAGGA
jgi:hypothetical protein